MVTETDHQQALLVLKQWLPNRRRELLDLLCKYVGTPFENDPAIVRLREQVDTAEKLIEKAGDHL